MHQTGRDDGIGNRRARHKFSLRSSLPITTPSNKQQSSSNEKGPPSTSNATPRKTKKQTFKMVMMMSISRAFAFLSFLTTSCMPSYGATSTSGSDDECSNVVVSAEGFGETLSPLESWSGVFSQAGTTTGGYPLYKNDDGGLVLLFSAVTDEDSITEIEARTTSESATPDDGILDVDISAQTDFANESSDRRSLQACGYWVLAAEGEEDTAEYPVLKVSDCADLPYNIDVDSEWVYQNCSSCDATAEGVGEVSVTLDTAECEGSAQPTASPSLATTPSPGDVATGDTSGGWAPRRGGWGGPGMELGAAFLSVAGMAFIACLT